MIITLRVDENKEKTYSLGFISGAMLRRTFATQKSMKQLNEESLDEAVDYVVDLFGRQFTRDEFYSGVDVGEVLPTIIKCIEVVSERTTKAVGAEKQDPNE